MDGGRAELLGDEARHLGRVLRAQPGQIYEISDRHAAYLAEIVEAQPDRVAFRVLEPITSKELPIRVTLYAALIKFDRFEWMVEKATELGADRIVPFEAGRSERGLFEASRKRSERWDRLAKESSQQSRRLQPPVILPAARFDEIVNDDSEFRYFLEEGEAPPLSGVLPRDRTPQARAALLLGPEGGWVEAERQRAAAAGWQAVSLSPQVLRAETAASAAIAILVNAWMR